MTEAMEVCFAMALRCGELEGVSNTQRKALKMWGVKVKVARVKLDRKRRQRAAQVNADFMRAEIRRILPCRECGAVAGNPLLSCRGGWECALERLRYRSSELPP